MIKIVSILFMLPSLCFSTIGMGARIFPDVAFEIQETTGFYSEEEIKAVADYNMLDLRSIYLKYLEKGRNFEGEILIKFTIAKNGKVANAGIMHSTTGNAEFDTAIKNKITTWKWNATESSNSISTVLLRFTHIAGGIKTYIINSGPRSSSDIAKMVANFPRLRKYVNKYLKLKSSLNVSIVLRFIIAGNGDVINVDIVASTAEYAEFDEAIQKEISTWKWKPIEDGNTTVTVSFIFRE